MLCSWLCLSSICRIDKTAYKYSVGSHNEFCQKLGRRHWPPRCPRVSDWSAWYALHLCQFWWNYHNLQYPLQKSPTKCAFAEEIAVCNAVFRLTISCSIPETCAIKFGSCWKFAPNSDGFGPQIFLTQFYKFGSPSNVSKCGEDRWVTLKIRQWKKINDIMKTE